MTRSTTPPVVATASDAAPRAVIDRLQDILSQLDIFLADWFDRLDYPPAVPLITAAAPATAIPAAATSAADQVLAQRIQQFELDKRRWQAHRDSETQRLKENFEQLTTAWLQLEAERRTLLQAQQTQRGRRPLSSSDAVGNGVAAMEKPVDGHSIANRSGVNAAADSSQPHPIQADAVQQFEQLRRQIDSSRHSGNQT